MYVCIWLVFQEEEGTTLETITEIPKYHLLETREAEAMGISPVRPGQARRISKRRLQWTLRISNEESGLCFMNVPCCL